MVSVETKDPYTNSEPVQGSKMKLSVKAVNGKRLLMFLAKMFHPRCFQGSKYTSKTAVKDNDMR